MKIIEHFFRIIAPHECIQCYKEGRILCLRCTRTCLPVLPGRCYRCFRLDENSKTCAACRRHTVMRHVWVRTEYNETARKIIHTLKFSYAKEAATLIASELMNTMPRYPVGTIITHVPAASSHIRLRGFDQSALIARELARMSGFRHMHLIARMGQQRQVGSSQTTRREQMKSAFRPLADSVITGANIILIDDVLTTGSTLEAASLCLKQAGAKTIDAAVFAQAL